MVDSGGDGHCLRRFLFVEGSVARQDDVVVTTTTTVVPVRFCCLVASIDFFCVG